MRRPGLNDPEFNHVWSLHEFGIDRRTRVIYLVSETGLSEDGTLDEPGVEHGMVSRFLKNLHLLETDSSEPILIRMKTCGGDVQEGFAVYDAVKASPCCVTILSYTHARSMSSIILQAADKRVLMPSSYFMFHRGTTVVSGEAQAVRSYVGFGKIYDELMLDVYVESMKAGGRFKRWSTDRIRQMLKEKMGEKVDVYLTAPEAVSWGLADAIYSSES